MKKKNFVFLGFALFWLFQSKSFVTVKCFEHGILMNFNILRVSQSESAFNFSQKHFINVGKVYTIYGTGKE